MSTIDLVHLVWVPLGLGPLERFLRAHRANPPGLAHQLTIVFSGYRATEQLRPFKELLKQNDAVPRVEMELPGPGWDIGSYRMAAERCTGEWICFLNSYSRPLVGGWLDRLLAPQFRDRGLGLTGATGNLLSAFWHIQGEAVRRYSRLPIRRQLQRRQYRKLVDRQLTDFPSLPGPIIRTNAFALRRDRFVLLRFPPLRTKRDTHEFESGWLSLSRQILGAGQAVAVVGRCGGALRPDEWPDSRTYGSGDQENLLVADNRTAHYQNADAAGRAHDHRWVYIYPPDPNYEPYPGCFVGRPAWQRPWLRATGPAQASSDAGMRTELASCARPAE